MGSVAEVEIGTVYLNTHEAVPIATTLEKLGHPQGHIFLHVDNSTASDFANGTIKQK